MTGRVLLSVFLFWIILLFSQYSHASFPHAPHDLAHGVSCESCHSDVLPAIDRSAICDTCHDGVIAPAAATHSSTVINGNYTNWGQECLDCHDPHFQAQLISFADSAFYLATGTISIGTIDDNGDGTSSFDYTSASYKLGWDPVADNADWGAKTNTDRGLILVINKLQDTIEVPDQTFEITLATGTSVTVNGILDSTLGGRTFGVMYGQLLKSEINTPNSGIRSVKLFDPNGGFVDEIGLPPEGVCQVCHTGTTYWQENGTGLLHPDDGNIKCNDCHLHTVGFKGSCEDCHGYPPGALVSNPGSTGSQTPGAHARHVTDLGMGCDICHKNSVGSGNTHNSNLTVTMGFYAFDGAIQGGEYDGQAGVLYDATLTNPSTSVTNPATGQMTCSNLHCHGNYSGSGKNASPVWDDPATGDCGTCHDAANNAVLTSGSHAKHAGDDRMLNLGLWTNQKNIACTLCHDGIVAGTGPAGYSIADKDKHVNATVDWKFDTTDIRITGAESYSVSSGSVSPTDGDTGAGNRDYGTCSNVYCHSNVQPDGGIGPPDVYTTPANLKWGTVTGCFGCHSGELGTPANGDHAENRHNQRMTNPATATGSHYVHLGPSPQIGKCESCHNWFYPNTTNQSQCGQCHGTSALEKIRVMHVNGNVDVLFNQYATAPFGNNFGDPQADEVSDSSASYNGTPAPGDGYGICSNVYCHSNGKSIRTRTYDYTNTTPVWGTADGTKCNSCHGKTTVEGTPEYGMPDYVNGSPKENSHQVHIDEGLNCNNCHAGIATLDVNGIPTGIANIRFHTDVQYYIVPYSSPSPLQYAGRDALFSANPAKLWPYPEGPSYCNNNTCHGEEDYYVDDGYAPVKSVTYWGEYLGCGDCHLAESTVADGQGDQDSYVWGDGVYSFIDNHQWTDSGHGKASGLYDVSGNPAADFTGSANCKNWWDAPRETPADEVRCDPCLYCHDDFTDHDKTNSGPNFFRLANYDVLGNGWNDVCLVCHKTDTTGYDPDGGGGGMIKKTATVKIAGSFNSHWGAKHGSSNDGGSLCWDCHDPHGDRYQTTGNIYMIQKDVTKDKADAMGKPASVVSPVFVSDTAETDYVESSAPFDGICNVCHTATDHYTSTSGDDHPTPDQKCTDCHEVDIHYGLDPDLDTDGDTVKDIDDNCPDDPNTSQDNNDGDIWGDACDACPLDTDNDIDGDSICGDVDTCPQDADDDSLDSDTICACTLTPSSFCTGVIDNCPNDSNPGQEDQDGDGIGDVCDPFCFGIPQTDLVKHSGSTGFDVGSGITLDTNGNIYLTGRTGGYMSTEGDPDEGTYDIFLGKYDSDGTAQWIRQTGTSESDQGNGIALDTTGNIYVTGDTKEQLPGSDLVTYPTDAYAGDYDVFITKYNNSGTRQWVRQMGTTGKDYSLDIAIDSDGNSYIAGYTAGTLPGANASAGNYDIFIAKYDTDGATLWVKQFGTGGYENWGSIALDPSETYFYVTGSTSSKFPDSPDDNAGGTDIFVAKFEALDGENLWVRQLGTSNTEVGRGVAVDGNNNVYITGYGGAMLPDSTDAYAGGLYDAFVAKYDSVGNKMWVRMLGTYNDDLSYGITLNSDSSYVYVAGKTKGPEMFDQANSSNNQDEVFFARFYASNPNDPDNPVLGKLIGTTSADEAADIVIDSNGASYVTGRAGALLPGADTAYGSSDAFIIKSSYCP